MTAEPLYPIGLKLTGRRCLVVGGGRIAARKVAGLLACGADVTVVAPAVHRSLAEDPRVTVERRRYREGDVEGYRLVITATGDPAVDQAVYDEAEQAGVWVNSADDPERCAFTLPAVERRGPVTVTVATGGESPALAVWLRDRIAAELPDRLEAVAEELARLRAELHATGQSTEGLAWGPLIEALFATGADAGQHGSRVHPATIA